MKWIAVLLALIVSPVSAVDIWTTVIGQAAATLQAGQWVKIPSPTLTPLVIPYSHLYWSNSGLWDAQRQRFAQMSGSGACCEPPGKFRDLQYDAANNVWTISAPVWLTAGHAYDGNALDPATGDRYFVRGSNSQSLVPPEILKSTDGGATWAALPRIYPQPFQAISTTGSIAWFPDAQALVYIGSGNQVAAFRNGAWQSIPGVPVNAWYGDLTVSEYNPVHRAVWFGSSTSAGVGKSFRLDYNTGTQVFTVVALPAVPFPMKTGAAQHMTDHISGEHLIMRIGTSALPDRQWWGYNLMTGVTRDIPELLNAPWMLDNNSYSAAHAFIPELGVFMAVHQFYTIREVYLYKHVAGAPPPPPPPPPDPCIPAEYNVQPPLAFCPA